MEKQTQTKPKFTRRSLGEGGFICLGWIQMVGGIGLCSDAGVSPTSGEKGVFIRFDKLIINRMIVRISGGDALVTNIAAIQKALSAVL